MLLSNRCIPLSTALLALLACQPGSSTNEPTAHQRPAPPEDWPAARQQSESSQSAVMAQGPAESTDNGEDKAAPTIDRFKVGTFNLDWAFDEVDDRSEAANTRNAPTEADWNWKVAAVGKILIDRNLDIVALQSIGGRREIIDIVHYVMSNGGPNYDVAYIEGTDRVTGQQVAVLSRFLVHDVRRTQAAVTKHLIADVMLPDYTQLVVVNAQLRGGKYASQTEFRRNEARRLRREIVSLRASGPVLVLGDIGSHYLPENEEYPASAPGMLSFADAKDNDDKCYDSGESYSAQITNTAGDAPGRMIFCGIMPDIDAFDVVGESVVVNGTIDDPKANSWKIPAEERDVSTHYLLTAEVLLKKPKSVATR